MERLGSTRLPAGVQDELAGHATVAWAGRPGQGLRFRLFDLILEPFFLLWASFPTYMLFSAATGPNPALGAVLPLSIFFLVGAYMCVFRFFVDAYRRSVTWYVLTPDEAIIVFAGLWRGVRRVALRNVVEISLVGNSSIRFGSPGSMWAMDQFQYAGAAPAVPTFEFIVDATDVYRLALQGARH